MQDENDKLPSDAETGALKPQEPRGKKQDNARKPEDRKTEEDPSEQPS